ncbi:hypothetical protein 2 [Yongsan picorna-like virus 3]|uniref:hypothetical protein 2 n=1 Tax=Yongsan picorna-like virus 3 TaxID=2315806 RepID=UPI000EB6192E|nr:hypothetical protein 2 [Yongsan picorna-like virus 3]AXV43875.1 hypothetical protein 2 [Yongsan picorna-like virus 3]
MQAPQINMEQIVTTNPIPVSGTTSTVPLSIEGTATAGTSQNNIVQMLYEPDILQQLSWHGKFTINQTQSRGASVFTWDFAHLFRTNEQLLWVSGSGKQSVYKPSIDYNFVRLFFARMSRCNFFLRLIPVKVADCRVSLNVLFDYASRDTVIKPVTVTTMSNDNMLILLDDPKKETIINVPAFWLVNYIPNNMGIAGTKYMLNSFMPTTRINFTISSPYQPNLIQPDSFEVIVEFGFTEKQISGYSSNTSFTYYGTVPTTSEPRAWVFNTVGDVIPP